MSNEEKLQRVVSIVDNVCVNPDVEVDYFIPGVLVTKEESDTLQDPYVEFSYSVDGTDSHSLQMHLNEGYLEKSPEDMANLMTYYLEQFMGEIDSRQYGAQ